MINLHYNEPSDEYPFMEVRDSLLPITMRCVDDLWKVLDAFGIDRSELIFNQIKEKNCYELRVYYFLNRLYLGEIEDEEEQFKHRLVDDMIASIIFNYENYIKELGKKENENK